MSSFLSKFPFMGKTGIDPSSEATNPSGLSADEQGEGDRCRLYCPENEQEPGRHCFGISDRGQVRDLNEDYLLADCGRGLLLLSDGMGGANAGEVASQQVVSACYQHLARELERGALKPQNAEPCLRQAVEKSHEQIRDMAARYPDMGGMGCTLVAAWIHHHTAFICHIGDSRAYLLDREGGLEQLTEDHSVVWNEYRAGRLTREEARKSPQKNKLTQALGMPGPVAPGFVRVELKAGDRLLLCSDGLWEMLADSEIAKLLAKDATAATVSGDLVEAASRAGGRDNISVVLWIQEED